MLNVVKIPTTALFIGPPGVGKSHLICQLLQKEYLPHFQHIIFICPTICINSTYINSKFIWSNENIYTIRPGDRGLSMQQWVDKLSQRLIGKKTLFILDDCIGDKDLDKTRGALYDLAINVRHRGHTLFFLTQTYKGIPKKFRRLATMLFVWFLKDREDVRDITKENNVIDNWSEIFKKLRNSSSKHTCVYVRAEKPFSSVIINGDNERS